MTRKTFITLTALVALAVGAVALFAPAEIMASKGVAPNAAAANWIREVGILLLALGVMSLLVRGAPGSHTLRGFLVGSALVHVGLFRSRSPPMRKG